jgi:prepilin signal peptidase PulO-like enzyme (type II secretory pathway)
MEVLIGIVIGIVTGLVGWTAIPLSRFIYNMEQEPCVKCYGRASCFAMKEAPLCKTNNLNQWMLVSYYAVKKRCEYVLPTKTSYIVVYFIVNCILTTLAFWSKTGEGAGFLCAISTAALLSLAVVDWCTQYIPLEMSGVIFVCGLIQLFADFSNWFEYVIGLIAVSGFFIAGR